MIHKKPLQIKNKIIAIEDINDMLDIIDYRKFESNTKVKVTVVYADGESVIDTDPSIFETPDFKCKKVKQIEMECNKIYNDKLLEIYIKLCTEINLWRLSEIIISSDDENIFTNYFMKYENIVKKMSKQSILRWFNKAWVIFTFSFVLSIFLLVYETLRFNIVNDNGFIITLFFINFMVLASIFMYVSTAYPDNEIILGKKYASSNKTKKRIIKYIIITFILIPILEKILHFIWG